MVGTQLCIQFAMQEQCRCIVSSTAHLARICALTLFNVAFVPFTTAAAELSAAATPPAATAAAAKAAAAAAAAEAKGWFTGAAAHKREKRVIVTVGTAGKDCTRQQ
jgi:uncharacterized membrane protein